MLFSPYLGFCMKHVRGLNNTKKHWYRQSGCTYGSFYNLLCRMELIQCPAGLLSHNTQISHDLSFFRLNIFMLLCIKPLTSLPAKGKLLMVPWRLTEHSYIGTQFMVYIVVIGVGSQLRHHQWMLKEGTVMYHLLRERIKKT